MYFKHNIIKGIKKLNTKADKYSDILSINYN